MTYSALTILLPTDALNHVIMKITPEMITSPMNCCYVLNALRRFYHNALVNRV